MSDGVFRRTRTVRAKDIDLLGHVNNAVWLNFVVRLAEAHSSSQGLDFETVRDLGGLWIVRRHEIDYRAPALCDEELVEETWISRLRGARSVRHSRFTRRHDGTELVRAITQWAFVDAKTLRPARIRPEILSAFILVEADPPAPGAGAG
jgi:acyl-CoA thioester hydrolase